LGAEDIDAARAFYGSLFGWEIPPGLPETGGYTMGIKNNRNAAGLAPKMDPEQPSVWTTYIATDNVDESVAKITANGGQVLMEPMDVMDVGRMAIAQDPGGAAFGLWQARAHVGAGIVNEPGSLCWNENMTRSWEACKTFYAAVFGWGYTDMSDAGFKYATFSAAGKDVGGIGELSSDAPAEAPSQWMTYFAVADTDVALDHLVKLGGSIVRPASDSPYGRMATVTDDHGVTFSLISVPENADYTANSTADGTE
jgi:predicted enzyme related to lactoylglutathione lyase